MRRMVSPAMLTAVVVVLALAGGATAAVRAAQDWQSASAGSPSQAPVFTGVAMQDAEVGLAVGVTVPAGPIQVRPSIYRTADGGATWTPVYDERVGAELGGVAYSDAQHAWAAGTTLGEKTMSGLLLASADGGLTWHTVELAGAKPLTAVQFPTASVGYVAGDGGEVWKTTDGGATWARSVPGAADVMFESLSFIDATHGWACGPVGEEASHGGRCYATSDGGATWTDVTPDPQQPLLACSFVAGGEGWVLGEDGDIFHTTDGGATWARQPTPLGPNAGLLSLRFVDAENGWAVGSCGPADLSEKIWGVVLHTTDGGRTWTQQDCGVQPYVQAVWARDAQAVWLAGIRGIVLRSQDGGGAGFVRRTRPVTTAQNAVSVRRGATATFRFTVADPGVPRAEAAILIYGSHARRVRTVATGFGPVGVTRTHTVRVTLSPGRYTWKVVSTDYAGWTQAKAGTNTLVVK